MISFFGAIALCRGMPQPKGITLLFKKKLVVRRRKDEILFKHSTYNSNFLKNILNFSSQIPLWFSPLNIIKWFIVHYPLLRTPHESSTHLSKCQCCFPASKGEAPALHIMYFFSSLHLLMPTIAPSPLHWLKTLLQSPWNMNQFHHVLGSGMTLLLWLIPGYSDIKFEILGSLRMRSSINSKF